MARGRAPIAGPGVERGSADEGYDGSESVAAVEAGGAEAVIPPRSDREAAREYDGHLHEGRDLVGRLLNEVGHRRRGATRYEEAARNDSAFRQLAAVMVLPA